MPGSLHPDRYHPISHRSPLLTGLAAVHRVAHKAELILVQDFLCITGSCHGSAYISTRYLPSSLVVSGIEQHHRNDLAFGAGVQQSVRGNQITLGFHRSTSCALAVVPGTLGWVAAYSAKKMGARNQLGSLPPCVGLCYPKRVVLSPDSSNLLKQLRRHDSDKPILHQNEIVSNQFINFTNHDRVHSILLLCLKGDEVATGLFLSKKWGNRNKSDSPADLLVLRLFCGVIPH